MANGNVDIHFNNESEMQAQDLKEDILANETKVWQTFLGAHPDTAAFEQLVVSDYLCIEANGVLMTKAQNVAQLTHLTFSSFKIQDPQIRVLSPSAALIVARVRFAGTADEQSMSGETLTSTVWSNAGTNGWLSYTQRHSQEHNLTEKTAERGEKKNTPFHQSWTGGVRVESAFP